MDQRKPELELYIFLYRYMNDFQTKDRVVVTKTKNICVALNHFDTFFPALWLN